MLSKTATSLILFLFLQKATAKDETVYRPNFIDCAPGYVLPFSNGGGETSNGLYTDIRIGENEKAKGFVDTTVTGIIVPGKLVPKASMAWSKEFKEYPPNAARSPVMQRLIDMNNGLVKTKGRFFDSATNKLLSGVWMSTLVQFFPTFSDSDNEKRREGASMGIPVFAVQEMCTCEGFDTNSKELTCPEDKRKDWTNDVEKIAQDLPVTIGINPLSVYPTGEPSKTGLQENGLNPFVQLSWKIFQASQIYEDGGPPYHCPGYIIGRNGLNVGLNSWTFEGFEFFRLPENGQGYSGWTKDIEFEGQTVTGPILLDTTTNESAPQSGTDVRIVGREALEKYDYVYSSSHNIVGFKVVKEEAEGA